MGDVYMVNGKILSGLPNHAKDIIFDNDGTTLSSTNTEDAIKEVNSKLPRLIATGTPNTSMASQLTELQSAFNSLTDEQKRKSYIIGGSSKFIYMDTSGNYTKFETGATTGYITQCNILNAKYYSGKLTSSGYTVTDNSSVVNSSAIELYA